jgi:RNA polymerase sigma factor (sigma-70 family)
MNATITKFEQPGKDDRHLATQQERSTYWAETLGSRVRGTICRQFGVPLDDVEDVEHEVWAKAARHLSDGSPLRRNAEEAWPWLKTIILSVAMDYHRRRKSDNRRRERLAELRQRTVEDDLPVAQAMRNEQHERNQAVWEAMDSLNPEERRAVEASVLDEQRTTEIARREGIGRKTAERRIARGLRLLGERLEQFRGDFQP